MKIELKHIKLSEIYNGYKNSSQSGVIGYGGLLNIRPAFQREYVYKEVQRNKVIESVRGGFPINIMYWSENEDGTFEVIDGQQRTISICDYMAGDFSVNAQPFHNLTEHFGGEQEQMNNYEVLVYICSGTEREKLDWFKTINIAGEKLFDQELRNATYTGSWLYDAKRFFSKTGCAAYTIGSDYLNGSAIRQDYLETTIDWISGGHIEDYMGDHQKDKDASELIKYFKDVMSWVRTTFSTYRKEMKGIPWGILYNKYGHNKYISSDLEDAVSKLMADEDVTSKKGVYEYVLGLCENPRLLNIRAFDKKMRREAYERQNGDCKKCTKNFKIEKMQADHITPWAKGGQTSAANCQMLCEDCNRTKSDV
jgi:hypothetical protein